MNIITTLQRSYKDFHCVVHFWNINVLARLLRSFYFTSLTFREINLVGLWGAQLKKQQRAPFWTKKKKLSSYDVQSNGIKWPSNGNHKCCSDILKCVSSLDFHVSSMNSITVKRVWGFFLFFFLLILQLTPAKGDMWLLLFGASLSPGPGKEGEFRRWVIEAVVGSNDCQNHNLFLWENPSHPSPRSVHAPRLPCSPLPPSSLLTDRQVGRRVLFLLLCFTLIGKQEENTL